jgi:hypothetical protein
VRGPLGVVAKLGFFLLVVAVGVALFRQQTRQALADRWAMRECRGTVEDDIRVVMPWADPKVERCEGIPTSATCSVELNGRGGRKTAPVKDWDCSKRHVMERFPQELARAVTTTPGETGAQGQEILERAGKVNQDFAEGIRYVAGKLRERQELLGQPGPFPPVVPGE